MSRETAPPAPATKPDGVDVEFFAGWMGTDSPADSDKPSKSFRRALSSSGRELASLLAVSRAVVSSGPLSAVLDQIAEEAAGVARAKAGTISLLTRQRTLRLGGSFGLGRGYGAFLSDPKTALGPGRGPAGLAIRDGRPAAIEEVRTDPRFKPWRGVAEREGYRSMLSLPLISGGETFGALTVYRAKPGPWAQKDFALLGFFADHAAAAIHAARLIERQNRQLNARSRLVRTLREQTHEHANRLHTIGALLALGDYEEALSFVAKLESAHHLSYGTVLSRIGHATLAGLIVAEIGIAKQRGITLSLDRRTRLQQLPASLGDPEAVSLLGNLLQNALDAAETMPRSRRKVSLAILEEQDAVVFQVRDWGSGMTAETSARVFERSFSTKVGHVGVGLSLVSEIVSSAGGTITFDELKQGIRVTVRIPT